MAKYKIKVIPNAKKDEVIQEGEKIVVRVTVPPEKGKANNAATKILSKHFNSKVRIISGEKSREKLIETIENP